MGLGCRQPGDGCPLTGETAPKIEKYKNRDRESSPVPVFCGLTAAMEEQVLVTMHVRTADHDFEFLVTHYGVAPFGV